MCCDSKGARKRHTHNQIRSGRFSQRRVPCCGTFVICTKEQAPPVTGRTPPEQHPTYDTPAVIVTAPLPQRLLRKVGDTKQTKRPAQHLSPVWAPARDPVAEKRSCLPTCLPPVLLLLLGSRTTSGFRTPSLPPSPNRHSPPVQLVSRTTRLACSSVLVQ